MIRIKISVSDLNFSIWADVNQFLPKSIWAFIATYRYNILDLKIKTNENRPAYQYVLVRFSMVKLTKKIVVWK